MNHTEELLSKLKALLGVNVDATEADATDLEARAKEAKLRTKATDVGTDVDAGTKALAAVKALEEKLAEATACINEQAKQIESLQITIEASATAQKAYQGRAEKAIKEVADLLVVLNAKPDISAPADQEKMAAIEAETKAKIDAAQGAPRAGGALTLKRFDYADGKTVVKPI